MNKLFILIGVLLSPCFYEAQTTQDTIDNPYWQSMMFDRTININTTRRAYDLYFSNKPKAKGSGHKQFERWYTRWAMKVNPDGTFPAPDRTDKEMRKFKRNNLTPRSATGAWVNMGPFANPNPASMRRGVGRINTIGFHPTNENIIYAGAPQGGFWYSTNKGGTWQPSNDHYTMQTLGVSDIVFIPGTADSVILIGTGDRDAGDANGMGVYRSTDGGLTFAPSNTGMGNREVNMFALNPVNNNTIFAAVDNGIYVSYDRGVNWTRKSTITNFKDIKYCPNDTMTIYATRSGTFYKSTNAGNTWSVVSTGINSTAKNRMVIGVTPANPNIVYILSSRTNNLCEAFYKSSNKGTSFSQQISGTTFNLLGGRIDGTDTRGQGWYDMGIECSRTDSNDVLVGGINIFKSTNGGTSWTASASWYGEGGTQWVHADIHYIKQNPLNDEVWVGSDGGVDVSTNFGATYTSKNTNLAISQFYNLGVSQATKSRFITGAQDNGTSVGSTPTNWTAEIGGDGMHCEISNFDTTVMFGNVQYGDLQRTKNNGASWQDLSMLIPNGPGPWAAPCHLHPKRNDIFVNIYKNANISKNIVTAGTPSFSAFTSGITSNGNALRFSNANDSLVFMGWSNGEFRYANILESTPSVYTMSNPNGSSSIRDIETSFYDEDVVYCVAGNDVFKSTNKGANWTNIAGNLPNIPMYSVVLDKNSPEGLYVGTDAGVFYKDSLMTNWIVYNNGIPIGSEIRDLEIVYDDVISSNSVIYAATYGRGLWKGDLRISETQPNADFNLPSSACATLPVTITNTTSSITNNGFPTNYEWTITPATHTYVSSTSNTSQNPIVTFNTSGNYTITLKASKAFGGFSTITKTNVISIGTKGNLTLKSTNDTTICPGDTIIVSLGGMSNYTFNPSTNATVYNDSFAYVFPITPTNYMIIGDVNGACFDTTYVDVKIKASAPNTMSGSTSYCNGDSSTISFSNIDTAYWSPTTFLTNVSPTTVISKANTDMIYNVRLVKSGLCDMKLNFPILVKTIPNFNLSKSGSQNLCEGDSMDVMENTGVPSIVWTPMTGVTQLGGASNYRFKPSVSTKYMLRTTDTTYCLTTRDSLDITMIPIPNVQVTGPSSVCGGANIKLIASGALSYLWSPGTYLNATNKDTVSCVPTSSIVYTITGSTGICSKSVQKTINVGTASVILKYSGDTVACKGNGIDLQVSGAMTYKWSPSAIVSDPLGDTIKVSTNSNVTLKVVGESIGCKDSLEIPIKINPNPVVTYQPTSFNTICEGDKVSLKALGALSYFVKPEYNVVKHGLDSFVLNPLKSTPYDLIGINEFGCSGSKPFNIKVNPKPSIVISPALSIIKRGQTLNINASGGSSYKWSPTRYVQGDSMLNTLMIKPDSDIVYTVDVTTSNGCTNKGMAIVYVQQSPNPPSSSIQSTNLSSILIYPNPAKDVIHIKASHNMKVSLYNMSGSLVKEDFESSKVQIIDVSAIASGTYLLNMEDQDGNRKVSKIEIVK